MLTKITHIIADLKAAYPSEYILVGGDFNMTPVEWMDRCPTKFEDYHYNKSLFDFTNSNSLIDLWRVLNPNTRQYSWIKPNASCKSRIDYWLSNNDILNLVSDCSISSAPLTDHCLINLKLESKTIKNNNKDYWKFNADLLNNEEFCDDIRNLILEVKNNLLIDSNCSKSKYLKFKIREFSIKFSKNLSKSNRKYETKLIKEINDTCNKTTLNENDK